MEKKNYATEEQKTDNIQGNGVLPCVSNCCDCFIGFLSGEEVRKSELKRMVNDIVELQPQLKKYGMLNGEPNTAKQIVDGRKGYLSRFSYCPYCGNKIDWKTVLSCCR